MAPPGSRDAGLVRAIGVRRLTATIVNVTIGAGIFVLPAVAAAGLGAAAPLAYLVCAALMALIVCCFAAAGSRVSLTGGLYAYIEVAFGPYRRLHRRRPLLAGGDVRRRLGRERLRRLGRRALGRGRRRPPARALLLAALFGGLAGRERPRRQRRGVRARRNDDGREARCRSSSSSAPGSGPSRRRYLVWPAVPPAADVGQHGHRPDLRVRRHRDRARAERRDRAIRRARCPRALFLGARDHDDALSAGPGRGAGAARTVDGDATPRRRWRKPRRACSATAAACSSLAGRGRLDVRLRLGRHARQRRACCSRSRATASCPPRSRASTRASTRRTLAIVTLRRASSARWPSAAASRSSPCWRTSRRCRCTCCASPRRTNCSGATCARAARRSRAGRTRRAAARGRRRHRLAARAGDRAASSAVEALVLAGATALYVGRALVRRSRASDRGRNRAPRIGRPPDGGAGTTRVIIVGCPIRIRPIRTSRRC